MRTEDPIGRKPSNSRDARPFKPIWKSFAEFDGVDPKPQSWTIDGLVARGAVTILRKADDDKDMPFMVGMLCSVASGKRSMAICGARPRPGTLRYLRHARRDKLGAFRRGADLPGPDRSPSVDDYRRARRERPCPLARRNANGPFRRTGTRLARRGATDLAASGRRRGLF